MQQRETCISNLMYRISTVPGLGFSARNPDSEPSVNDFPAVLVFELADNVEDISNRGGYPSYKRQVQVAIEIYLSGSTEDAATTELTTFVNAVKTKIYAGGANLGIRGVYLTESGAGRIMRPAIGGNTAGVSLLFNIRYIEDVATLF